MEAGREAGGKAGGEAGAGVAGGAEGRLALCFPFECWGCLPSVFRSCVAL